MSKLLSNAKGNVTIKLTNEEIEGMRWALLCATKKNIESVAEDFITYNLLDCTDGRGNILLHKLTLLERWDIAETILKLRPDLVNHQNNMGLTALHIAVTTLNVTSISRLLERGANPNIKTGDGNTPLHLIAPISSVVKSGTKKLCIKTPTEVKVIAHLLIEENADLNAQNKLGNTPLHLALIAGSPYAKLLIPNEAINCKNQMGWAPLHIAVMTHNSIMIEPLLQNGADPNCLDEHRNTALHLVVIKERSLPELTVPCATIKRMISQLLEAGAKIELQNQLGNTPLHEALLGGEHYYYVFNSLINQYIDTSIENKNLPKILNCQNNERMSVLHIAARQLHVSTVEMLLGSGADPNLVNSEGDAALHMVARSNPSGSGMAIYCIIPMLLGAGANINAQNNAGLTSLHIAIKKYSEGMINLLREKGADPHIPDNEGNTAITTAVRVGLCTTAFLLAHNTFGIQKQHDETKLQGLEDSTDPDV